MKVKPIETILLLEIIYSSLMHCFLIWNIDHSYRKTEQIVNLKIMIEKWGDAFSTFEEVNYTRLVPLVRYRGITSRSKTPAIN